MKTNTIAAWVFGGLLAAVAVLNVPVISERINGWLGKQQAPMEQRVASAPESAAQSVTETGDRPKTGSADSSATGTAAESSADNDTGSKAENAEVGNTEMAALPKDKEAVAPAVAVPSFGLLRVEPDGSTVIAGQAGPNATIEILSGEEVIAETQAEANGDFVAVLDDPLAPGDYELVLRATQPDGEVAMSTETAIISVPEKGKEGELLALVEQPGEPSRLINTPKPSGSETVAAPEEPAAAKQDAEVAAAEQGSETAAKPADNGAEGGKVAENADDIRIEAVEIDGDTVFVAGAAKPGSQVRVYANEILLGDTTAGPNGRFLVEVKKDLPVGDYIIRADVISGGTAEVVARAAVPFTRDEGTHLAAVATEQPQQEQVASAGNGQEGSAAPEPSAELPDNPPEVAKPVAITGQLRRTDSSVIIRRGDTLWHISRRIYGEGVRYTTIYLANQKQIKDPDMIWPGQIFSLPENSDG